ncbi:lipoyltransferase 1, mitochondrial [Toxorhynchites rutilus septentrionalis]|uniref:lipoyltransferase 1, mitochondrial n=1 Tax=Toxorhynchites rutilus septentrionalis TaxID=329112 RepID=UPI002478557B|nr:lipoyltransferase 1, mitochondrial [Toxorhynchites rutilus septentrionalis]
MAALIVPRYNTAARAVCKLYGAFGTNTGLLARTITTTSVWRNQNNNSSGTTNKGKQLSAADVKKIADSEVKKSVFISQSNDVFTNLALEDWIYRNFDFAHHHILMLWINNPTVVIGRHQNPFAETNVSALMRKGVELARRNSGGGAVFHDAGNLNCTFFTPRVRYDRKYNLNLITRALYREYGISAEISDRDDVTLMGKKVSGTAAKLGQPNAYHHCTLLVNSDKLHLGESLAKDNAEIISKATASVPSPVKNLADVNRTVNIQQLLSAIGYEFLRTPATQLTDGGRDLLMKQLGFQLINPTEKWFPGLSELRENFASWDWRFGKTPKFAVQKDVQLKSEGNQAHDMKVRVDVEKGLIQQISLLIPEQEPIPVVSSLIGTPYMEDCFHGILEAMKGASTENVKHAMGL